MTDEAVEKTVTLERSGIYCFKCGSIRRKGQKWVEVKTGPRAGWQGCPGCSPVTPTTRL